MSDFFLLAPDELEPTRPARRTLPPMVSAGLAPTANVPTARGKAKESPPAYAPCPACAQMVLAGQTRAGIRLMLDVSQTTYCVLWPTGEALPVLELSRGYPVHECGDTPPRKKETA